MAVAPEHILKLSNTLKGRKDRPKSYKFSGIVGDKAHSFGYHLSPNDLPRSDYSRQTSRDQVGAKAHPNWASAWDLSFNSADMKTVTKRLLAAAKAKDPRVKAIREFCGTLNGYDTYPWDLHNNRSEGINSWDSSHTWHVHISLYRDADSWGEVAGIIDVICGVKRPATALENPTPVKPYVAPKFPLGKLDYYGTNKHNRDKAVLQIQKRLQQLGFASKAKGWADGYYGPETAASVNKFKAQKKWGNRNGKVGLATWNVLFK